MRSGRLGFPHICAHLAARVEVRRPGSSCLRKPSPGSSQSSTPVLSQLLWRLPLVPFLPSWSTGPRVGTQGASSPAPLWVSKA